MYKISLEDKERLTFLTKDYRFNKDGRICFYDKYNKYKEFKKNMIISIEEVKDD